MTYFEKSQQLVLDADVAMMVLANEHWTDCEFMPLKPRLMSESHTAELRNSWPGRGLKAAGTIGLVGAVPRLELKVPIELRALSALAAGFLEYLRVLLSEKFSAQMEALEVQELCRLWRLDDPRLEA